ncbi:ABC-type multidrug transport system, ATPase and permease component [Desulfopila aestuarii DSM 18488]|uniref:ABC-type multidrug transport system, ATPase and permease component n=1 Tax=Desulfopila aestuarii DSM 18488 TaxID=1121416 RepID=A0A1M7YCN7_9BACT|nr:ABC-type multidrug transport system, ATPase and permease component [Desulfopila aestuarii DSM 18488]
MTGMSRQDDKVKTQKASAVTDKSLFYWVINGNVGLQLLMLVLIVVVVAARVVPLEMQKRIINESIALRQFDNLINYSLIYISSVALSSGLKLAINYLQTIVGERAMLAMRRELYRHILTLPLSFFRKTQPGMVVSSLVTELSTAGTFAGMAITAPLTNVLTLLSFAGYLLWLNPMLALATLTIYPVIVFLLPWLQKKTNRANSSRVDLSRELSSQIAESITGIQEVQVHGAYPRENSKFGRIADVLQTVRVRWSFLKFSMKTANNFFVSLGPFVVFLFGGYLIMQGELELGAMVAFLSAQEKLYDPWKELIDYYQVYQDARVRYYRTMDQFSVEPDFDPEEVTDQNDKLNGRIEVKDLLFETSEGVRLLQGVNFLLEPGMHLAVVGFSGSGKSTLVQCIARMHRYTGGSITIDDQELETLTKKEIVANIGYISQNPFVFTGTIRENLIYAEQAMHEIGRPVGKDQLYLEPKLDRLIFALQQAGLFVDVMRFGLESSLKQDDSEMIAKIIRIREKFRENFGRRLASYVEFYQQDHFLYYSTIADNILFGSSVDRQLSIDNLTEHRDFFSFLEYAGLLKTLLELGVEQARQTIDILAGFDDVDMFYSFSPVPAGGLEECKNLLERLKRTGNRLEGLLGPDQVYLLKLALGFIPGVHKTASLTSELEAGILAGRAAWVRWCDEHYPGRFNHYQESEYIYGQTILNNIFFGRIRTSLGHAQEKINQAIIQLLIEEDILEEIAGIGMEFQVGSMGDRLSGGQRQKLAIARVLLKQPRIVIMDEATSALDNKSQARIQRLVETRWKGKRTVISVVHRLDAIRNYDRVAVMKAGKIIEFGGYGQLMEKKGVLYELVSGKR